MNGLTSKLSLFDIVAMFIPGYLFLYLLKRAFFTDFLHECDELTYVVVVFTMSYITGMAIHQISKLIFKFLRNNPCIISRSKNDFTKNNDIQKESKGDILEEYYTAYYRASVYVWSSIPVLESQYSFLRSMAVIEFAYMILGCKAGLTCCQMSIIAVMFIITIILIIKNLLDTSYRVWEDDYYLNKINETAQDQNS